MAKYEQMIYLRWSNRKWTKHKVVKAIPIFQFEDGSYELLLFTEDKLMLKIYSNYLEDMQQKDFKKKYKCKIKA